MTEKEFQQDLAKEYTFNKRTLIDMCSFVSTAAMMDIGIELSENDVLEMRAHQFKFLNTFLEIEADYEKKENEIINNLIK